MGGFSIHRAIPLTQVCVFGASIMNFESVGSRVLYELDYRKPVLYVFPIQSILGKLAVVPVGDTGTIPYHLRNVFPGAPGDRRPGAGDGCGMWFVNSWALGWSRDM
jgi:hypothetical protein